MGTSNIVLKRLHALKPQHHLSKLCQRGRDFIELRAERDLLCGLTACSAEGSNNGTLKPIDHQIFPE